jgi:regulator of protease activity HflC (stomatin/prohibitin superfamily)
VNTVTRDGQRITINYTVRFRLDALRADWIAQNLGSIDEIVERIVKTDSRIWVRNVPKQFSAEDLYTGNIVEVQDEIFAQLEPLFSANGLILDEVGLRSIIFTEEYADAIENKQIALEQVTTAQYVAQQETYRAQQAVTQAQGRADSVVVEARGDAESLRLRGQALQEFPEVLQLQLINALGPNIRVIMLPSGQQFILGEGVLTEPATP